MATYTQILYQVIFSTKYRTPSLSKQNRARLFRYLHGTLRNRQCNCYEINGIEDHIHLLFYLHPSMSLATLVKEIKGARTYIIKKENLFEKFNGWQIGYGAFTYSQSAKQNLINYILNQEEHHKKENFIDEYKRLLKKHNIPFDPKLLE